MTTPVPNMNDYFPHTVEYPLGVNSDELLSEILPFGTLWSYVSSSFANGFLNTGKLTAAVLLNRYCGLDEEDEQRRFSYAGSSYATKRQMFEAWMADKGPFHVKLGGFRDDLLILIHLGEDAYLYLWLDCDVSDCCVGRFRTSDTVEQIIVAMVQSAKLCSEQYAQTDPPIELDVSRLRGWLSF